MHLASKIILYINWRKRLWREFGPADGPRKTLVFIAKTNDFGDGREKGAFGAPIVGLGEVPQMVSARTLLYKRQMRHVGRLVGWRERHEIASIRAPNEIDLLDLIWKCRGSGCCVWSTYTSTIVPLAILYPWPARVVRAPHELFHNSSSMFWLIEKRWQLCN